MGHAGVGWVIQGGVRLDESCWGGMGRTRVGWGGLCSKTT